MSRKGPLTRYFSWWRGQDLNLRPSGYEPDELPDRATPRRPLLSRIVLLRWRFAVEAPGAVPIRHRPYPGTR